MKKGEVYSKHVRGSRYAFNCGKLFYKYPGGGKNYAIGSWSDLIQDCCDITQKFGGRLIINEKKEIVVYRQKDSQTWLPYFIGDLLNEIRFEGIDNNPQNLMPGLLWTGFASHHGATFHLDMKDHVYFQETYFEIGSQVKKKYFVKNVEKDMIERLFFLKQGPGSFHINEFGQVWAPVDKDVITESEAYHSELVDVSDIQEQFSHLSDIQKHTINKYSQPCYSKFTKKTECWFPIYIGKYSKPLEIIREEKPHTIIDPDIFFAE
jgi:hypothetical protein